MRIPNDLHNRRRHGTTPRRGLLVLTLLLVPASVWAMSGCKSKTNAFAPPPPPEVTVAHPIHRPVTRYLEYTGATEAYQSVDLRARVTGFLDQVLFKPGAVVKKGDLLFVIDPRVYEDQARQALADSETRKAALHLAELTLQRNTEAIKSSAVSHEDLDKALAERDQSTAQLNLSEAALASARLNVEFTQVRAPIDGRITKNFVDIGNLVGAPGQATLLATIVSTHPIYVSIDTSESDLVMSRRVAKASGTEPGQIAPGQWWPADLAIADSDEFNIHGHVDYVDPALNPQSATIHVRCRFENENEFLLPGLFVRLRFAADTSDAMLVPDIALLSDQNGRYALVVNDKDVVEVRRVKIGTLDGTMRVVLEGLSPSDRVVLQGLQRARPGIAVKPTLKELEASKPSTSATAPTESDAGTSP
jgi:multidrug efflux system membrane fusion protein